ncbi:MAG: MaoC family dehydratase N-terminal domain-containing protein, partial [Chloroflexi bacterium]|nr:MaoC family dehydratase N-terminal domain-containing protein [Chloroflexota bacterium]
MIIGSVVTPEMRKAIGTVTVPEFAAAEVERWAIDRYLEATGDANPLWRDQEYARKSRWGGVIAPPTFVETFSPINRCMREGAKNCGPELPFPTSF